MANKLSELQTSVRLSITNPRSKTNSVFGKGIFDLCLGVRQYGSLNAAAKAMGMAYSKAWRIIRDTEEALGVQLLIRDGAHGSNLTPEGERLLDLYARISKEISEKALELYQELA